MAVLQEGSTAMQRMCFSPGTAAAGTASGTGRFKIVHPPHNASSAHLVAVALGVVDPPFWVGESEFNKMFVYLKSAFWPL